MVTLAAMIDRVDQEVGRRDNGLAYVQTGEDLDQIVGMGPHDDLAGLQHLLLIEHEYQVALTGHHHGLDGASLGGRIRPESSEWVMMSPPIKRVETPQEVCQT